MKISDHLLLLIILPLFFTNPIQSSFPQPHFVKSVRKNSSHDVTPQEYFEVTRSLPTDDITPACSVSVLNHSFGNTYGDSPVSVSYIPPPSKCVWSLAVLEFRAECKGQQYDRIAGVWIDGVELLRTSTAEPTEDGIFWKVRKDVTRYSSIITQSNLKLAVMLENIVNGEYTGVYHVNISFLFYSNNAVRFPLPIVRESEAQTLNRKLISVNKHENDDKFVLSRGLKSLYSYDKPADLIVPVSGDRDKGFWFKIEDESDVQTKSVKISQKTYKAVLELYVSFHGDDEFWYLNPSDAYVEANHLHTGRAHGAYREVLVTLDGQLVDAVVPFPVIYTGGINPLFWEPVVSIGAFNLPSYDIDFTPFLGLLLDNKKHSIGLQVADGISFWLVDANLHLWLDHSNVKAKTVKYKFPSMEIERKNKFNLLDGEFEIEGERESQGTWWVSSSLGNLTTILKDKIKFKNKLKFKDQGTKKELDQDFDRKTKMKVTNEYGLVIENLEVKLKYPLDVSIETRPGSERDTHLEISEVEQERSERYYGDQSRKVLSQKQKCNGTMVVKGGDTVLSGTSENHQDYSYKDGFGCYSRKVDVVGGLVVADVPSSICNDI